MDGASVNPVANQTANAVGAATFAGNLEGTNFKSNAPLVRPACVGSQRFFPMIGQGSDVTLVLALDIRELVYSTRIC